LITVTVTMLKHEIRQVDVSGHGGDKKGSDLVCAAVSAITQTALAGLLHYGKENVKHHLDNGRLSIEIMDISDTRIREIYSVILNTMLLGLKGIAREHPRRVSVVLNTK
jgi:uncharacterized protein YsxB (DUF464 family)